MPKFMLKNCKYFAILVMLIQFGCSADRISRVNSTAQEDSTDFRLNERIAGQTILGPFTPAPAFTFYWLNNPANCRARMTVTSALGENALLRVYSVNDALGTYKETLLSKLLISLPKPAAGGSPTTKTIDLPLLPASTPSSMIEIRLSAGQNRLNAYIAADCAIRDSDYGVSF